MNFTIKSRKTGEIFSFYAPESGGYVHLESPGHSGNTGAQICCGGGFMGSTLSCGASEDDLVSTPRLLTVFHHFHCPLLVINAVRFPPFQHH